MRRRSTILDVLREAQLASQQAAMEQASDQQQAPQGEDLPAEGEATQADGTPARGEPSWDAASARAMRSSPRLGESRPSWLMAPAAVPRIVLLGAAVAVLLAFWGMYALGARSRPALQSPSSVSSANLPERKRPARMREQPASGARSDFATNDTRTELRRDAPRVEKRLGFRIVTYNKTARSRQLALAMRAYLRQHVVGSGVTVEWFDAVRIHKYIVAVMFPREFENDKQYRARLLTKLRAIPAPDPRDLKFDFAKLEGQVMTGKVRAD